MKRIKSWDISRGVARARRGREGYRFAEPLPSRSATVPASSSKRGESPRSSGSSCRDQAGAHNAEDLIDPVVMEEETPAHGAEQLDLAGEACFTFW